MWVSQVSPPAGHAFTPVGWPCSGALPREAGMMGTLTPVHRWQVKMQHESLAGTRKDGLLSPFRHPQGHLSLPGTQ